MGQLTPRTHIDTPRLLRVQGANKAQPGAAKLARRLFRARLLSALGRISTMLLAMFFVVQAFVLGWLSEKLSLPSSLWMMAVLIGFALIVTKSWLDAGDEAIEDDTLRAMLIAHVAKGARADPMVLPLLATAVDCRVRLESGRHSAAGGNAASASALMKRIDGWFDRVCDLAARVADIRGRSADANARQALQRERIRELKTRAGKVDDPLLDAQIRRTVEGIETQMKAAAELSSLAERGFLRFESSVAELDAVTSKFALMLSRGEDLAEASSLDEGIRTACDQIDGYLRAADRVEAPISMLLAPER